MARFEDVPEDHVFHDDIEWIAARGITKGANPPANTLYKPNDAVTRGQMAAFLRRAQEPVDEPPPPPPSGDFDTIVQPGDDIQAAIASVGAGGTTWGDGPRIGFAPGVYAVDLKPLRAQTFGSVEPGAAVLDGAGLGDFAYAFRGPAQHSLDAAPYVTIQGLEVRGYMAAQQRGAIYGIVTGDGGWRVVDCDVHDNEWAGVVLGGNRAQILGGRIHHNRQLGFGLKNGADQLAQGIEADWNNIKPAWAADWANRRDWTWAHHSTIPKRQDDPLVPFYVKPGWEAGTCKCVSTTRLTFRQVHAHHNFGPGLWCDINNVDTLYEDNLVEEVTKAGIFHEISLGATIRGNTVRGAGWPIVGSMSAFKWQSGIHSAQGGDVLVEDNVVDDCVMGIVGVNQCRSTYPAGSITGHRNTVTDSGPSGPFSDCGQPPSWDFDATNVM